MGDVDRILDEVIKQHIILGTKLTHKIMNRRRTDASLKPCGDNSQTMSKKFPDTQLLEHTRCDLVSTGLISQAIEHLQISA